MLGLRLCDGAGLFDGQATPGFAARRTLLAIAVADLARSVWVVIHTPGAAWPKAAQRIRV